MLNLEKRLHVEVGKIHDVQHFKQMEAINTFPPRNTPGGQLKHTDSRPDKTVCERELRLLILCWILRKPGGKHRFCIDVALDRWNVISCLLCLCYWELVLLKVWQPRSLFKFAAVALTPPPVGRNRPGLVWSRPANIFDLLSEMFLFCFLNSLFGFEAAIGNSWESR